MIELYNEVKEVMNDELQRANDKFPLFRSHHEGLAIIEEEVFEAQDEANDMAHHFNTLKDYIFSDETLAFKRGCAKDLRDAASRLACETIQVAAMAQKFLDSFEHPTVTFDQISAKCDAKIKFDKGRRFISIPANKYEEVMKIIGEEK